MVSGKKTGKNNYKVDGREKVIAAAFELFATKGYAQTSVDSIAAKAKVSKGLIYYYFKSKEEILKAIFAWLMAEAEIAYAGNERMPPKQYLKMTIENSFQFITLKSKLFRLVLGLTVQQEVIKGLKNELEYIRREWMGRLEKAFGALGYENPEMEVYQLCAIFDGVGLAYLSMQDYPVKAIRQFIEAKYDL